MMQYTNRFSCAINNDKNEFVLNLMQEQPVIEEDGSISEITIDTIASVTMTLECARNLARVLGQLTE